MARGTVDPAPDRSESSPSETPPTAPAPDPTPPEPLAQTGNFIHGLIGLSHGGFSETVRNSISSLTRSRDPDASSGLPLSNITSSKSKPDNIKGNKPKEFPQPPAAPEPRLLHILSLPPEILLLIIQRLPFADIVRLRKTCKTIRAVASPHQIRVLFGAAELRAQLLGHCRVCLRYDPFRSSLLQSTLADPGYPLASQCLDCAVKARDPRIRVGRIINLANFDSVWVCRWCGYPIVDGGAWGCEQMHRFCYKRYNDVLFVFFSLGWLQLGLGIVASALAWRYYRHAPLVFGPTVTNFILLWICLGILVIRGNARRTYHWTLALELTILGLWVPPVYHIVREIIATSTAGASVSKATQAILAMFCMNMLFRFLNLLGNIVLLCRVDVTDRRRTISPAWMRPFHYLATGLVIWTYPQYLEEKYS
ncbi:hypothetical protein VTI74DRAFT_4403 [Chaetomium olivicolor]